MAFLNIKNIKIKGISACVPERVEENRDYDRLSSEEIEKYIKTTGVERRHCAIHDGSICTSDLCFKAAEKLIAELGWEKSEIGLLLFVSQTADYRLPMTACILQDRLGLSTSCLAFDITLGCSGFLIGLGVAGNLLAAGTFKKALVMVGNTQSQFASYEDRSMYLLLGDAGTVTALEYSRDNYDVMEFFYMTDGSGKDFVIVPDGGSRNPVNDLSFIMEEYSDGIKRTRMHEKMDGMEVFSYAMSKVPECVEKLRIEYQIDMENIDYVLLHQANMFLCEKLRKKMNIPLEKVPYNIKDFGNTSGATIPLLMVTNLKNELEDQEKTLDLLMATIGVGFSLSAGRLKITDKIIVPDLLTL